MKPKDYRLLSCIIIIIACTLCLQCLRGRESGSYVKIYSEGELFGTFPLNKDREIVLPHNTIKIENNEAFVIRADCPDGLCMTQGKVSHLGDTVACLPGRMVMEVVNGSKENDSSYTGLHFDTVVNVTIYDHDTSADPIEFIKTECQKYELICSRTNVNSELFKLNHRLINDYITIDISGQTNKAYRVSPELYDMIREGKNAYGESDGAFDITVAPLSDLWHFKDNVGDIPKQIDIQDALTHVDCSKVILSDDCYVAFTDPYTMIDLGGLAKGYIGDRLKEGLVSMGIGNAVIALGGNVVLIGDGTRDPYKVGIKTPFSADGALLGAVTVTEGNVITSGTYERYFVSDGKLFHHILDPITGCPVDTDISSATVICDSSLQGDVLSTVLLSEGSKKAIEHAGSLKERSIYVILADAEGNIICDTGYYIRN